MALVIFSFLTGKADMHVKNFSRLRVGNDLISSTPVHDFAATRIALTAGKEEMALTINGKKRNLPRGILTQLRNQWKSKIGWQRTLM